VNYHFGAAGPDWGGAFASPFDLFWGAASLKDAPVLARPGWNYEFGARYWASTGKFVWDVKQDNKTNISRLTYSGLDGNSGELFARIDTPYSVFVKGTAGLGAINSGKENDEDWSLSRTDRYSNTVSNEGNGTLGYATADVGFTYLQGADYRVGPFVGYSYLTQGFDSRGCVQIAVGGCVPSVPTSVLVGSQTGEWNAVRLGASADYSLGYGFRLTTDAAWLPTASFSGRDNHLLRPSTTYSDQKADGQGVELEAILSYDFSNRFNLGVGGRYWAMWGDGNFSDTDYSNTPATTTGHPERISTERYGLLVQGSYKLGGTAEPLPLK
jgi:outer membrane protease